MRKHSIIQEIAALLNLFEPFVPDRDSNRMVLRLCSEKSRWHKAHGIFSAVRACRCKAERQGHTTEEAQYEFEEWVLKTLYNLTKPEAPFDAHSPYWIVGSAIRLAGLIGISTEKVLTIIAED